jgi:hypothetical protein
MQVLPSSEEFNPSAYLGYIHAVGQMCALSRRGPIDGHHLVSRQKGTTQRFS